jgi:hypothetical protein
MGKSARSYMVDNYQWKWFGERLQYVWESLDI